jgi:hydrogenase maturation factor HypF (carbamoyltransferase family)
MSFQHLPKLMLKELMHQKLMMNTSEELKLQDVRMNKDSGLREEKYIINYILVHNRIISSRKDKIRRKESYLKIC